MILATHIIFAGALTRPLMNIYNPLVIFVVAFASHFIMDAIPHINYKLSSIEGRDSMAKTIIRDYKLLARDLTLIGTDILFGSALLLTTYALTETPLTIITFLAISAGAITPDGLQPVYWLFKKSPLRHLHKFHSKIQENREIKSPLLGIATQAIIIALSVYTILIWS